MSTPAFASHLIDVGGLQIRVKDSADGPDDGRPTFVLVHGLGVSSRYFHPLAAALAAHGRVVAVDLPGFGKTINPDHALRIADFARTLVAAVRIIRAEDVVLFGHSMGCQVVVEAMAQEPGLARVGVLAAPVVNEGERSTRLVVRRFVQSAVHEPPASAWASVSAFARCGPRWLGVHLPAMVDYRIENRITDVAEPLLVIGGPADRLAPPAWVRLLAEAAPTGSAGEIVAGAAHQMIFTHAELVARLTLDFAAAHEVTSPDAAQQGEQ